MFVCVCVSSTTVQGLQGRVDSLEKSNSKLIEEVSPTLAVCESVRALKVEVSAKLVLYYGANN